MEVIINGNIVEYESDFDADHPSENVKNGWKVSAGDYFKFPVKIDRVDLVDCFIKRFDKKSTEISGYDFLLKIKGKKLPGLPVVFDLVQTKESDNMVFYLFLEFIPGDTLDNLQRDGFTFVPSKLGEDLYFGLKSIHDNGSWFPDFDPKNFVRSKAGDYFIIDLDSTYPLTSMPAASMFGSKDFWAPSYEFYRLDQNGGLNSEDIKKMRGDVLNHLNLIYLMGLYSFYIDEQGKDLTFYSIMHLNNYLLKKHRLFSTTMIYCFNKQKNELGQIIQRVPTIEVFRSYMETVLFPENFERTISNAEKKPEILMFTANGKTTHDLEINPGNRLVLQWETRDTTSTRLLPGNRVLNNKGTIAFTPVEDTIYSLQAVHKYKSRAVEQKKSIEINIYDPVVKKPAVEFIIVGHQQKALLLENTEYTIKWKVSNGQRVFLDDREVLLSDAQTFIASNHCTHTLRAVNSKNGKVKNSIATVEIETEKRPEINLTIVPLTIRSGETITLYWNSKYGRKISILQDGVEIGSKMQAKGSLERSLSINKDRPNPYAVHFTASVLSKSGVWYPETPEKQIVIIQKKRSPVLYILAAIILIILIILLLVKT